MELTVIIHARGLVPKDLQDTLGSDTIVALDPWTVPIKTSHRAVLSTAATPCANFRAHAQTIIEQRPDDPICLLPHGACFRQAHKQGKSWVASIDGACMDAMILPQTLTDKWLAWHAWALSKYVSDEDSLMIYLWSYGVRTLHPMPSLVRLRADEPIWMASATETWKTDEVILLDTSYRRTEPGVLLDRLLQDGIRSHYDHKKHKWTCEAAARFAPHGA